jgi:phosphoribosylglycinamide formyltransferase-1
LTGIAIFASGRGSNAEKILEYFSNHPRIRVTLVLSNKAEAGVQEFAKQYGVPFVALKKAEFQDENKVLALLKDHNVDFIALAGFLLLIPGYLVNACKDRILNIHPALLPDFGGKGMYSMRVHEAVKASNAGISGMTVHLVNPRYDEGRILFQSAVKLDPEDSPEDIAGKVLKLEHKYYAKVIEDYVEHFGGEFTLSKR